jgi:hypothetical protein
LRLTNLDIQQRRPRSWRRFGLGVLGFTGVLFLFTRGVTPPGVCGDVIRHNRAAAIDATPYFYTEVENIVELQAGLDTWWPGSDSINSRGNGITDSSAIMNDME